MWITALCRDPLVRSVWSLQLIQKKRHQNPNNPRFSFKFLRLLLVPKWSGVICTGSIDPHVICLSPFCVSSVDVRGKMSANGCISWLTSTWKSGNVTVCGKDQMSLLSFHSFSRWPHRLWPSCPLNQLLCTCRPQICHSLGQRMIL